MRYLKITIRRSGIGVSLLSLYPPNGPVLRKMAIRNPLPLPKFLGSAVTGEHIPQHPDPDNLLWATDRPSAYNLT